MQAYRRNLIPGGTYFFTVNLQDRASRLLVDEVALLRAAVASTRTRMPFRIDACVILPDHMHCIWTLPPGDTDYSTRWRLIKAKFSHSVPRQRSITPSHVTKGELGIWQRRYWEHTIRDDRDFTTHFDYVHFNPVKHGHVARAADWPYSSFHRCLNRGLYPPDWTTPTDIEAAGERVAWVQPTA